MNAIAVLTGYSFLGKQIGNTAILDVDEIYDVRRPNVAIGLELARDGRPVH